MYILGGTIVVLVLAINIGVFINIESKVSEYFDDHYESVTTKIEDYKVNIETAFSEYINKIDLNKVKADALLSSLEQKIPHDSTNANEQKTTN